MNRFQRTLACTVLALTAGTVSYGSAADERTASSAQWAEAAARQAQEAQRRQREARLRWDYQRRRSAAHARMPSTLYASTPSSQAHTDLACPVLVDDDTRRLYRDSLKGQTSSPILRAPDVFHSGSFSNQSTSRGVRVFAAQGTANTTPWPSKPNVGADGHKVQASGWAAASIQPKSQTDTTHHVYLVPAASEPLRQGFVRVINHSAEAGEISIDPVDDGGRAFDMITLSIDANETIHFNSNDLETGNEGKGLSGSTGSGEGAWRLAFTSDLDIEVLSYIRTTDGFLTAMHDVAPADGDVHRVAIFNPGSNRNQVSRLRLINPTDVTADVTIRGMDDKGMPGSGEVSLSLDAGTAREITAEQLEEGGTGLTGMLGDGSGKWRLEVESEQAVVAMSLLESPTDHLTNLSTVPEEPQEGVYSVPLFPAAGDASGRQGFVRVINNAAADGEVRIKAYDETERDYEAMTLTIGANEVVHFNSDDLEQGSPQKGLSGGTGAGEGDWRLELTSDLEIEVLSYIRTTDGILTAMHDVVPSTETRHRVAVFNPGSNRNQESLLRLINPGDETAEVTITGIDDKGAAGAGAVSLSLLGGGSRTVGAWDLESGAQGLDGALGDGAGKWQLLIDSDRLLVAMSLLRSPTGHLTNLSTAPVRGARSGAVQAPQTAEAVFRELISGPIVQSKCVSCHVEGGASGNTRLVFVTEANPDHEAINLQVFEDFLDEVEDGANYVLNKIQGALGHGGGIQVAAGTQEYASMEHFLSLLGADVGPVAITPDNLFDDVEMESARSTLRRAAIVFAGRVPTAEEYESIETGGLASLRTAVRGLMKGPGFHEFLIRASNDRLLTDRDIDGNAIIPTNEAKFVAFTNLIYEEAARGVSFDDLYQWEQLFQYGFGRAPLELIAHVAERDLPYTEVLTADYIMANPFAARGYGASSVFDDPTDVHEFRPSEIVSYYRDDGSKRVEETEFGTRVLDPGNLATDYPHAGILNTTVFLLRYPTTATNRNRARSRWTYYHFLGLDVEKSAARTADPVALADKANPTMRNPACTVCHSVLDPVAGAFQNYGDIGLYRDQPDGLDSLDASYKEDPAARLFEIGADSWAARQTITVEAWMRKGDSRVFLGNPNNNWWDHKSQRGGSHGRDIRLADLVIRSSEGDLIQKVGVQEFNEHCEYDGEWNEGSGEDDHWQFWGYGCEIPTDLPADGIYVIEAVAWADQAGDEVASLQLGTASLYSEGDTWYRDMRSPGFGGVRVPDADDSLPWLARRIVADDRFGEAAVKFWWPAVMGREVAEPPEDESDADFDGRLLASNAQSAEVNRLARGFRRGFGGRSSYNLKDLLVEIVLSRWFRAQALTGDDPVRTTALRSAGARRLLTPEELARKTLALTGFQWGRPRAETRPAYNERWSSLTDVDYGYGLLYGGIDSAGVTERATDLTSVMAGVAQSHAMESSCPIVQREFYLLPEDDRLLFRGIDKSISPVFEFGGTFEVEGASRSDAEIVSVGGRLRAGEATVSLAFLNDHWEDGDRNLRLDRLMIVDADGSVVGTWELETTVVPEQSENGPQSDHFAFYGNGVLDVAVTVSKEGDYDIEVIAWGDQAGDELPKLEISVDSDTERSAGSRRIKAKLADLYGALHGISVTAYSPEVVGAYDLFVDVWQRRREREDTELFGWSVDCDWISDQYYLDGIVENAFVYREDWGDEWGARHDWDWERVEAHLDTIDWSDTKGVAETWTVVLAYLLMDYRYLYL